MWQYISLSLNVMGYWEQWNRDLQLEWAGLLFVKTQASTLLYCNWHTIKMAHLNKVSINDNGQIYTRDELSTWDELAVWDDLFVCLREINHPGINLVFDSSVSTSSRHADRQISWRQILPHNLSWHWIYTLMIYPSQMDKSSQMDK